MLRRNLEAGMWKAEVRDIEDGTVPAGSFSLYGDSVYVPTRNAIYAPDIKLEHVLKIDFNDSTISFVAKQPSSNPDYRSYTFALHFDGKIYGVVGTSDYQTDSFLYVFDPITETVSFKPPFKTTSGDFFAYKFLQHLSYTPDGKMILPASERLARLGLLDIASNTVEVIYRFIHFNSNPSFDEITYAGRYHTVYKITDDMWVLACYDNYEIDVGGVNLFPTTAFYQHSNKSVTFDKVLLADIDNFRARRKGVKLPNKRILYLPGVLNRVTENFMLVDEHKNVTLKAISGVDYRISGVSQNHPSYYGAARSSVTGDIWLAPYQAEEFAVIEPTLNSATRTKVGINLSASKERKFFAFEEGPDKKLYALPWNDKRIIIVDPVTKTAKEIKEAP